MQAPRQRTRSFSNDAPPEMPVAQGLNDPRFSIRFRVSSKVLEGFYMSKVPLHYEGSP